MHTLEIRCAQSPEPLEKFAGMDLAYETTITDGVLEVLGEAQRPKPPTRPRKCSGILRNLLARR